METGREQVQNKCRLMQDKDNKDIALQQEGGLRLGYSSPSYTTTRPK